MLQSYLKTALRNLQRNKTYSVINITGLALGIASCLLLMLYVQDEFSFDRFHTNAERIYRIRSDVRFSGSTFNYAVSAAPIAPTLKQDMPDVEAATRFKIRGAMSVKIGGRAFSEENVCHADPDFFRVFSVPVTQGDGVRTLAEPNMVVLTEETAQKYFGNEQSLGKTIEMAGVVYTVGAVMKRLPNNSHFHCSILISMTSFADSKIPIWASNNYQTYILLRQGADAKALEAKLTPFVEHYFAPELKSLMNMDIAQFHAAGNYYTFSLQPLLSIHLHSHLIGEFEPNGNVQFVWIFAGVAVFVLLIACINFMNLSTARAANRAKEVGIRKVLGSQRVQLIAQFLAESVLLTFVAMVVAVGIVELALPAFNQLSGKSLSGTQIHTAAFWGALVTVFLGVGLLAGVYPAFVLSAFQPVKVLKGRMNSRSSQSAWLRSGLVVFQFTASIVLVIGTIVMFNQLHYIQSKNLGFDREQVLVVDSPNALGDRGGVVTFKQEIQRLAGIKSVSIAQCLPVGSERHSQILWHDAAQPSKENSALLQTWTADADYIRTMGMSIVKGRDFDATIRTDSMAMVINESMAHEFFGTHDPLGKQIHALANTQDANSGVAFTVIGVVKDFHFESLHENVHSIAIEMGHHNGVVAIRFDGIQAKTILAHVEAIWKRLAPDKSFSYSFMDEDFEAMYRTEQRTGLILSIFAGLAIFVACLGLFALASFTTEQRTKEIGIRKVLGASVTSILTLLSKDFLALVAIAIVVATPLAYWAMSSWLQDFAYRTELSLWIFVIAGASAFVIALATVIYQALRAATANPVEALRSE